MRGSPLPIPQDPENNDIVPGRCRENPSDGGDDRGRLCCHTAAGCSSAPNQRSLGLPDPGFLERSLRLGVANMGSRNLKLVLWPDRRLRGMPPAELLVMISSIMIRYRNRLTEQRVQPPTCARRSRHTAFNTSTSRSLKSSEIDGPLHDGTLAGTYVYPVPCTLYPGFTGIIRSWVKRERKLMDFASHLVCW